jgi:hypothetical protein
LTNAVAQLARSADFDARHGPAHSGHGPARLKQGGTVGGARATQDEPALGQSLDDIDLNADVESLDEALVVDTNADDSAEK